MPKTVRNALTARRVATINKAGRFADGGGLYLQVTPSGARSWLFRFMRSGKSRQMGLGSVADVSLGEARELAAAARKQLREGDDPIEVRKAARMNASLEEARAITFRDAAEQYIASHEVQWSNPKHRQQWRNTLATYAYPELGNLPVAMVDVSLIMRVLEPIWTKKAETAARLRGRIENILDWATVRGYRAGENPARWRGHLEKALPAQSKVAKVKHHAALPYCEIGDFMEKLRQQAGTAARALEFAILTGARTQEALGAAWPEIDFIAGVWTVSAERMKGRREHKVPLSAQAQSILQAMLAHGAEGLIFPGGRAGRPLSNMALLMTLRRMGRDDLTVHGFRSTFRDWAAETTAYSREVAEMALAHVIGDKVEAAYRRGDLFDKRKRLMTEWGAYCSTSKDEATKVVPIRAG